MPQVISKLLNQFISNSEARALMGSSEHKEIVERMESIVKLMPSTYGQDGLGKLAFVFLHYFKGDTDVYITEKDSEPEQWQAFGYTILNGDTQNSELGYVSIEELKENNFELDLHFDITELYRVLLTHDIYNHKDDLLDKLDASKLKRYNAYKKLAEELNDMVGEEEEPRGEESNNIKEYDATLRNSNEELVRMVGIGGEADSEEEVKMRKLQVALMKLNPEGNESHKQSHIIDLLWDHYITYPHAILDIYHNYLDYTEPFFDKKDKVISELDNAVYVVSSVDRKDGTFVYNVGKKELYSYEAFSVVPIAVQYANAIAIGGNNSLVNEVEGVLGLKYGFGSMSDLKPDTGIDLRKSQIESVGHFSNSNIRSLNAAYISNPDNVKYIYHHLLDYSKAFFVPFEKVISEIDHKVYMVDSVTKTGNTYTYKLDNGKKLFGLEAFSIMPIAIQYEEAELSGKNPELVKSVNNIMGKNTFPTENIVSPIELENQNINLTERRDTKAPNAPETTASEAIVQQEVQNASLQSAPYVAQSAICETLDTVVPASMRYEMKRALEAIDRRVNGIDEYVAEKLGFMATKCSADEYKAGMQCLCNAFSAEQVDAIAMAIYNIEQKSQACIIGDGTGVGKGRVAAAIILYGIRNGKIPVMLTEKVNLFSDLYRDLIDIGADAGIPLYRLMGSKEVFKRRTKSEIDAILAEAAENNEDLDEVTAQLDVEDEANKIIKEVFEKNTSYESDIKKAKKAGKKQIVPFILNGGGSKTTIKDIDGNILYKGFNGSDFTKVLESLKINRTQYSLVLSTYSQFGSARPTLKKAWIQAIASDAIFILDESHNASGSSQSGEFLRGVLEVSQGATFLSATFAKRPDNMPIYAAKTAIVEAGLSSEALVTAVQLGGVALQEILSSQLVREGQMIRRERSFDGVEVNFIYLDESQQQNNPQFNKAQEHRAIVDKVNSIVRDIILFQYYYINPIIEKLDKIAKAEGKEAEGRKGTSNAGVDNPPMFNGIFHAISILLFSLKAESVADQAILRMKQGKKPIIAFSNTMESFLDSMTNEDGSSIQASDIINADYSVILKKRLQKVLTYTVINEDGSRDHEVLDIYEMDAEVAIEYNKILDKINKTSTGITVSPIDAIIKRIEDAGFSVGEVTGRNKSLKLMANNKAQVKNRVKDTVTNLFRKFNENEIDCLLINQSGSTGASAQAKPNGKVSVVKKENGEIVLPTSLEPRNEVKQRVMIILQPELDINKEVQKRGRINRTGQVYKPIYDYVISSVPAEKRFVMMLKKKLKSLDANTTSNQKQSAKIVESDDFLNKYGDEVVFDYLVQTADTGFNFMIGDPLKIGKGKNAVDEEKLPKAKKQEDIAHRVSGRVAVLSVAEQEKFYNEVSATYIDLVTYYQSTGQYDLEVDNLNFEAETLSREIALVGSGGNSLFGRNAILEKARINNLRKPFTKDQLQNLLDDSLLVDGKTKTAKEISDNLIASAKKLYAELTAKAIAENKADHEEYRNSIELERSYPKKGSKTEQKEYHDKRISEIKEGEIVSEDWIRSTSEGKLNRILELFKFFTVGRPCMFPSVIATEETGESNIDEALLLKAIFLGFQLSEKSVNPYQQSKVKLRFAVAGSIKYVAVPASKFEIINSIKSWTYASMTEDGGRLVRTWDEVCKESSTDKVVRYIVTGNILAAFGKEEFLNGKLVAYTTSNNTIKKGIVLPEYFNPSKVGIKNDRGGHDYAPLKISVPISYAMEMITNYQNSNRGITQFTSDSALSIAWVPYHSKYNLNLQGSKAEIKPYLEDDTIKRMSNEKEWDKISRAYILSFSPEKIPNLLTYLSEEKKIKVELLKHQLEALNLNLETNYEDDEQKIEPLKPVEPFLHELLDKDEEEAQMYELEQSQKKVEEEAAISSEVSSKNELLSTELRRSAIKGKILKLTNILLVDLAD